MVEEVDKKITIAILGATSHIAQGLTHYFSQFDNYKVILFSRQRTSHNFYPYNVFNSLDYDLIVNCIGIGAYREGFNYFDYFTVTEKYDNMIIDYLINHPTATFVNFSTGSVHEKYDEYNLKNENILPIVKMNSEAKHRTLKDLNIIDIRLYSYFSRYANLEKDNYIINQLIKCVLENKVFITDYVDFKRDYIYPLDLFNIINNMIFWNGVNKAFDVGSKKSLSKKDLLDFFKNKYNLKYEYGKYKFTSSTGPKRHYIPEQRDLIDKVTKTSMETIELESKYFLENVK